MPQTNCHHFSTPLPMFTRMVYSDLLFAIKANQPTLNKTNYFCDPDWLFENIESPKSIWIHFRSPDPFRAMSRGRASKAKGSCAYGHASRDRCHQLENPGVLGTLFRRHGRNQTWGQRPDQLKSLRVARRGKSRNRSRRSFHRRGKAHFSSGGGAFNGYWFWFLV